MTRPGEGWNILVMKYLILSFLFPVICEAGMTVKFLPLGRVVLMMADNMAGQAQDQDAENLFKGLNVPEDVKDQGVGKKILLDNKNFSLLCVYKKTKDYTCNLMLAKNTNSVMDPVQKSFQYSLTGSDARTVYQMFHPNNGNDFRFLSMNQQFLITSSTEQFLVQYRQ